MSSQNDYVVYLNSVSTQITYYGLWIIFPTCIVGNLVSLFIYTRPNLNKKTNTGFLYSTLCILNLITVLYYSLVYRSSVLFKYTVSWPCGVDGYVRRTALNSITWIQVVICLDRFIAVVFPRKRNLMRKKFVLIGIMFAFLALILITNMTNLMTYPVTNANNVTSCFTASDVSIATSLIATMMRIFIPFLLMLGLNLLVIYRLKQSKIRVGIANVIQLDTQSRQQQQPTRQLTRKEFKFTVSTLIIDFLFLFFYLPLGVAFVVQIYNLFNFSLSSYPIGNAVYNLYSNLSQILALAHTAALFFIFLVFNRNFRTELFDLLRVYKFFPQFKPENTTNQTRVANNQTQFF